MEKKAVKQWLEKMLEEFNSDKEECSETPSDLFKHSITLFQNASLLKEYELSKVLELIMGIVSQFEMTVISNFGIRYYRIPQELKVEFIDNVFLLFRDFFSSFKDWKDETLTPIYMFWDALFYNTFEDKNKLSEEFLTIQNAIFACLCKILSLDSKICQYSVLHGFSHLKDDRCKPFIDEFISHCADKDLIEEAHRAKDYGLL